MQTTCLYSVILFVKLFFMIFGFRDGKKKKKLFQKKINKKI